MICRGLLLYLQTHGRIELPPIRWVTPYKRAHLKRPERIEVDQTLRGDLRARVTGQPIGSILARRRGEGRLTTQESPTAV